MPSTWVAQNHPSTHRVFRGLGKRLRRESWEFTALRATVICCTPATLCYARSRSIVDEIECGTTAKEAVCLSGTSPLKTALVNAGPLFSRRRLQHAPARVQQSGHHFPQHRNFERDDVGVGCTLFTLEECWVLVGRRRDVSRRGLKDFRVECEWILRTSSMLYRVLARLLAWIDVDSCIGRRRSTPQCFDPLIPRKPCKQ